MILGGDIGGTKCNLALFEKIGTGLAPVFRRRYESQEFSQFDDIMSAFLADARDVLRQSAGGKVLAAGFGVAGPVMGRRVQATNLHWGLDADRLVRQIDTPHVVLLNDLEATGYSMAVLDPRDFCLLNPGTAASQSPQAVIAAGTGLGEAILVWNGGRYVVVPTEGGHCDFAPRTEKEIEFLRYLKKSNQYVSFEIVLAGRGFYSLHDFLNPTVRHASFDQPGVDPAPEITERGLDGSCPVCVEVLDLFTTLYGAEAGNLALKALARGGVFVAGGIAPKILPKMKAGNFMRAFCEKEKFEEILSRMPVRLVLNEEAPLIGAAAEAARLMGN
jgi:glucokinase